MQRAREMGFDTENRYYRGLSGQHSNSVEGAQWFTPLPQNASEYAAEAGAVSLDSGPNVVPALLRQNDFVQIDAGGRRFDSLRFGDVDDASPDIGAALRRFGVMPTNTDRVVNAASSLDPAPPGLAFDNIRDDFEGDGPPTRTVAALDRARIRSINAAFDPARRNRTELLAGVGGGVITAEMLRRALAERLRQEDA